MFVAALATAIVGGSPEICYQAAPTEAERSQESVRQALLDAAQVPPTDYQSKMGWVLIALQNAFYQLLHAPNLEEGIVATVMSGGDTDTTAAIAGALLGAVHGRQHLPARWQRALLCCRPLPGTPTAHPRARIYWPVDALALAEALLHRGLAIG